MSDQEIPEWTFESRYKYWEKCKDIAMHFNDLILGLRIKAIGALGLSIALGTGLLKGASLNTGSALPTKAALAFGLWMLLAFWVSIFVIDVFYYARLLEKTVKHLCEIEKKMPSPTNNSIDYNGYSEGRMLANAILFRSPWVYVIFYSIPFAMLLFAAVMVSCNTC